MLGADPRILLSWQVHDRYWRDGLRLLSFRNTTGFAPDRLARELAGRGPMILEETADGST